MPKTVIKTDAAGKLLSVYSQAVVCAGLVFVSGTAPTDPATGAIAGPTIQEQTAQCLRNISTILEAAGSSLAKAVSATVILTEESDFPGLNEEWTKWFPVDPPARQGAKMPIHVPGMKVSIAMIAEVSRRLSDLGAKVLHARKHRSGIRLVCRSVNSQVAGRSGARRPGKWLFAITGAPVSTPSALKLTSRPTMRGDPEVQCRVQPTNRTTPPSARRAAPVVAERCSEKT